MGRACCISECPQICCKKENETENKEIGENIIKRKCVCPCLLFNDYITEDKQENLDLIKEKPVNLKNNNLLHNIVSDNINNIIKNNSKIENNNIIHDTKLFYPCNNKIVDIIYLIDSMGLETKNASILIIQNSIDLNKKYPNIDFQFGTIFYNDPIDCPNENNDFFQLTKDINKIKVFCDNWSNQSGGDGAEDWVGGYDIALNKILWRKGKRIIVHICDSPAHGQKYSKNSDDNHKEKKF